MSNNLLIIADTNVAYILYFFLADKILPESDITLRSGEKLKFHPIVAIEASAHLEAWHLCNQLQIESKHFPSFFKDIRDEGIHKLDKFINENMASIASVDTKSKGFYNKKKVYDAERQRIQEAWKKAGTVGNKVISRPSDNDYSVLFSAEMGKHKIATNDEILLSVAQEFLPEDSTLKAEDVVNDFYQKDTSKKLQIESIAGTLAYLNLYFIVGRALKSP